MTDTAAKLPDGLALLRADFPPHQISKLPKPTKAQTEAVKADFKKGVRCKVCGTWHHPDVVHLDYVGHAALTDRLLDTDPAWTWEPLAFGPDGLPAVDRNGGVWIKLTVCGVTRLGYGSADGKSGGDAVKEIIGDALRNAAMRFGAALELWHKGDLHVDQDDAEQPPRQAERQPEPRHDPAPARRADVISDPQRDQLMTMAIAAGLTAPDLLRRCGGLTDLRELPAEKFDRVFDWLGDKAAKAKAKPQSSDILDDNVPY